MNNYEKAKINKNRKYCTIMDYSHYSLILEKFGKDLIDFFNFIYAIK